jgi:WD40 repeat protein
MANTRENPYVGPRAFTLSDKEKLAGRDRDITAVYRLLISERIVLLFSPSGAGKTSLVQAGLIPRMKEKGFTLLPVIRVGKEVPADLKDKAGLNRYILSVLQSFEEDENLLPEKHLSAESLATIRLKDYLDQRLGFEPQAQEEDDSQGASHKSLLIFDQFEEILTVAPNDRDGKWEFFNQIGEALERRDCWALFVAREDFVAALEPYTRLIPTRLASTYRLDLLDFDSAQQAIRKPATLINVEYSDDAVTKLLTDLGSVRVQRADGSWEKNLQIGRYIEPVQLQVVCYRLWGKIEDAEQITAEQIESLGDVNEALEGFYADQVADANAKLNVSEKEIRAWFDNELITHNGIRTQVMWEEGTSGGLSNLAILYLERSHLIRGEMRRGVKWYELAHDRLIQPIRDNNQKWFMNNLSVLQRQAMLWDAQARPDLLLLRDDVLADAEKWAEGKQLTAVEAEFLKSCQDFCNSLQAEAAKKEAGLQRQRADELDGLYKQMRQLNQKLEGSTFNLENANEQLGKNNRALRNRNIIALVLLSVAVLASIFAFVQMLRANTQAGIASQQAAYADQQKVVAEAASIEAKNQQVLAVQAAQDADKQRNIALVAKAEAQKQAQINLSSSLAARATTLIDKNPPLAALLSIEAFNSVKQTDVYQPVAEQDIRDLLSEKHSYVLSGHGAEITNVIFNSDESALFTADIKTEGIRRWDLNASDPSISNTKLVPSQLRGKDLTAMSISPDNRLLALGSKTGAVSGEISVIYLLTLSDNAANKSAPTVTPIELGAGDVTTLAFGKSSDKTWLAAGMSNGNVILVDVSPGITEFKQIKLSHGYTRVNVLTFSNDGRWLAGGSKESQIRVWDVNNPLKGPASQAQNGAVRFLVYSPDGKYLVGAGETEEIYVYKTYAREEKPVTFTRDLSDVTALAFNPLEPGFLAVGHANGAIKIWNINSKSNQPVVEFSGGMDEISRLAFSPDGQELASASMDMSVRLWDTSKIEKGFMKDSKLFKVFTGRISVLSFSPKGRWLVTGTDENEIRLWDLRLGIESLDPVSFGKSDDVFLGSKFSPDGKWIAVRKVEDDNSLTLFLRNVDKFMSGNRQPLLQLNNTASAGFDFSPDSKSLVVGMINGNETTLNIYDLGNPTAEPRSLQNGSDSLVYVGFSPGAGDWLVSCDAGGNVRFWETANLDATPISSKIQNFDVGRFGFFFSPKGRWFEAVAFHKADAGVMTLWDLKTPEKTPLLFPASEGGVWDFQFSPDERWFVIGTQPLLSQDTNTATSGIVHLWDISSSKPELSLLEGTKGTSTRCHSTPNPPCWLAVTMPATSAFGVCRRGLCWQRLKKPMIG